MTIGLILRILTLLELAAAAGIAAWLGFGRGWSPGAALAAGLAAPLLGHAAAVGINFGLAALAGSPTPAPYRLGWAGALRLYLRELRDSLWTFQVALPWRAGAPLAGGGAASPEIPVLLIHGYFCNRQVWQPLARWLERQGHAVEAVDLEPVFGPIDGHVPRISEAVHRLRERTGAPRVALVCHSMGGLAARAWVRATGGELAARVVTLGTPHRGTFHARLGLGESTRQMRVDSDWLRALAASETPAVRERFTVILSHHDNIVAPQAIQTLEGTTTVEFGGLGHVTLVYDRDVWEAVEEALSWAD